MIHLDIDNVEKEELREVLQHCLNFLKHEVHHTDTRSFREMLKRREKVVENLLDQLRSDQTLEASQDGGSDDC
jgi:hypothetical protein